MSGMLFSTRILRTCGRYSDVMLLLPARQAMAQACAGTLECTQGVITTNMMSNGTKAL